MDYAMLVAGALLLLTATLGQVASDIWSKLLFRTVPMFASGLFLLNALGNLNLL